MALDELAKLYLPRVEAELRRTVSLAGGEGLQELETMLAYHMGWEGEGANPNAGGKRIRPLLLLLTTSAMGGDWQAALPAAAAVELVHNFSLIHDDIEDNSPLRRGRPTVWAKWGVPQAINTGDTMFTLATLAVLRLQETLSAPAALRSALVLKRACLQLTQGQYLDISYEQRGDLNLVAYWPMVRGKTASLLSACVELGAIAGGASDEATGYLKVFAEHLGLAFQAHDDLLGIWGDAALTGKSAESDLLSGKKSLPVLYALNQAGEFARRWAQGPVQEGEVQALAALLEREGARGYTQETTACLTAQALSALEKSQPKGEAGLALRELADLLLKRHA
jgi:geranylgeranyl diphosphate synthase type I